MTSTAMRLTSIQSGRSPSMELPITTSEVFRWVCDKQGVNPERLSPVRYRSLWTIADRAMDAITRLYAEKGLHAHPGTGKWETMTAAEQERQKQAEGF